MSVAFSRVRAESLPSLAPSIWSPRIFPASMAASFIGATQMFGMAGGSAGQFVVGPIIKGGLPWEKFWIFAGILGLAISVALLFLLPNESKQSTKTNQGGLGKVLNSLKEVFLNPQSILCGLISGLLFIPTTIFGMTWGVRFLRKLAGGNTKRRSLWLRPCRSAG